jgi:hypothetical protein
MVLSAAPEIVTDPTNQTALAGFPVQMSVEAKSPSPLTYQWMHTRDNVTPRTVSLPNATNSVLAFPRILTTSAGLYSVAVSDASGSITSAPAHLRILSLQLQPTNQIKVELWNNVRGTAVRLELTRNLVTPITTFTVIDALNAQFIIGMDLPYLFFRARPIPMP